MRILSKSGVRMADATRERERWKEGEKEREWIDGAVLKKE